MYENSTSECVVSNACHAVGNYYRCEGRATRVFTNNLFSVTCIQNGRKVISQIFQKTKKSGFNILEPRKESATASEGH